MEEEEEEEEVLRLTYLTVSRRRREISTHPCSSSPLPPPAPHLLRSANMDLSKQTKQIHQPKGQTSISPRIRINFTGLIKYRNSNSAPKGIRLEAGRRPA